MNSKVLCVCRRDAQLLVLSHSKNGIAVLMEGILFHLHRYTTEEWCLQNTKPTPQLLSKW